MRLDDYRTLGASGLKVSPICLGTLTFGDGTGYGSAPPDIAGEILDRYLDLGGNFIDTANYYSLGRAEAILGDRIGCVPERRARTVIATKFSTSDRPGDPNAGGASRNALIHACEQSLRRLRTDHIDLYWLHWEDPFTPIEETMRALDDLVRSGKVRYIGLSNVPAWTAAQAQMIAWFRGWSPLIAIQLEYSLLERRIEAELVPMSEAMRLGVVPFSSLAEGFLTGKYRPDRKGGDGTTRADSVAYRLKDRAFAILAEVEAIAAARQCSPASVALAWVMAQRGVASLIVGARTCAQLEENLKALGVVLGQDDLERLDAIASPPPNFSARTTQNMLGISFGGLTIDGREIPENRFTLPGNTSWV